MTADERWIPADWPVADGVVAGTTLRLGGVSKGRYSSLNLGAYTDDDVHAVSENRSRFRSLCELPSEPRWLRQVHGNKVLIEPPAGKPEATVHAMSTEPAEILAWLGPAISQANFEVGAEVREKFLAHDADAAACFAANERGRWQADLYGLARMRLGGASVEQVSGGEYCTFAEPERFFSYRRDGACGRMASFVFRAG
jgi:copper oxidase (laccase) domain-containing protein